MAWSGLQRAPPVGGQQKAAYMNGGHSDEEEEEHGGDTPWYEHEIETLKSSLKALNMQMFQERKAWLAEKTELERGVASGGGGSRDPSFSSLSSGVGSASMARREIERSPALGRGGLPIRGISATGLSSGEDPSALKAQLQAALAERDAARQEAAAARQEAQRAASERANLQREVMMLKSNGGVGDLEQDDRMAELEDERAALQAELDMLKESLKTNVLVPRAHMANLQQFGSSKSLGGGGTPTGSSSKPGLPNVGSSGRLPSMSGAAGVDSAAVIAKLNAEVTRLQADLYILKDECVPVPKAEFAKLKGVHSERAAVETELRAVKMELADVTRLNKMLREEMELIKEEHMAITMQEYDALRRAAAEKSALELKLEAQSKYYAQVPREELAELQSARSKVVSLEAQLSAMHAATSVGADERARALHSATNQAAELRVQVMELESQVADLQREVKAGEGRAQVITDLQARLRSAEVQLQASQQEKARAGIRLKALEEDLEVSKKSLRETQADSARIAVELGSVRDSASSMTQEVSQLARERGELDARLAEFKTEHETVTNELVDAKLELARLREMEVVYKKSVLAAKKQLYGTPSEAAA